MQDLFPPDNRRENKEFGARRPSLQARVHRDEVALDHPNLRLPDTQEVNFRG